MRSGEQWNGVECGGERSCGGRWGRVEWVGGKEESGWVIG